MQELILLGLFVLAVIYLYRKLFKNKGCNCNSKGCCIDPVNKSANDNKSDPE